MEIKFGLQHVQREIGIETDATAAEVEEQIRTAIAEDGIVSLTDKKGRKLLLPGAAIAYVDMGAEHQRQVGFGSL